MEKRENAGTSNHHAQILIADDYGPWRVQARRILSQRPEWQIICEVGDGMAAVNKTAELQPDVVLLDLGMPVLNGIEAAKQICQNCPDSRVLFVTQETDPLLKAAMLQTGAAGYVLKERAATELLPAISAALNGSH